jgi:hypothetical protein
MEPAKLPVSWRDHYEVVLARAKRIAKDVERRLRIVMGEDELSDHSIESTPMPESSLLAADSRPSTLKQWNSTTHVQNHDDRDR